MRRFHQFVAAFCDGLLPVWMVIGATIIGCAAQSPRGEESRKLEGASATASSFDAAKDRPPTAKTLYAMSRVHVAKGNEAAAELTLQKAIRENPEFMPAYCELAQLELRQRRVENAIQTLKSGLQVSGREPILLNDLGMCHVLRRDYGAALDVFVKAAAISPDDARYRSNTAFALGMLGRYSEAASLYQQVLPMADAHHNLGVVCEARGDSARAAKEFLQAKSLRDKQPAARSKASGSLTPKPAAAAKGTATKPKPVTSPVQGRE